MIKMRCSKYELLATGYWLLPTNAKWLTINGERQTGNGERQTTHDSRLCALRLTIYDITTYYLLPYCPTTPYGQATPIALLPLRHYSTLLLPYYGSASRVQAAHVDARLTACLRMLDDCMMPAT